MAKGVNPFAGRNHANTGAMSQTRGLLTISFSSPDLEAMIERLQKEAAIGATSAKRVRAGMSQTVKLVYGQAEHSVPNRSGKMKSTLFFSKPHTWAEGNVTGNVGSHAANYGPGSKFLVPFVLEGGRRPNARGRMEITPRRWLYHAYSRVKDEVNEIWRKVLEQIAHDLAGKGGA